jgi:organic hydroperoxide reductase OsmC/OhrA
MDDKAIRTTITREEGYRFRVRFDQEGVPELFTDESPPLGRGQGPTPSRLLAAAIGNCLAASLLFCMQKARLEPAALEAEVETTIARNAQGRLRIGGVVVRLVPHVTADVQARMGRCLELFESFCIVTESVRAGVDVKVSVEPETVAPSQPPA